MPAFSNSFSLATGALTGARRDRLSGEGDGSIADLFRRFAERRNGPKMGAAAGTAPTPGTRSIQPVKPRSILGGAARPKAILGY